MLCMSTERFHEQGGVRIAPAVFSCPLSRCTAAQDQYCCGTSWCDTHIISVSVVPKKHCRSLPSGSAQKRDLPRPAPHEMLWAQKSVFLFKKEMWFKTPGKVLNSKPGARHFLTEVPIRDLQRETLWVQAVQHLGSRWGWWGSWVQGSCSSPFLLHRSLHLGSLPPPDPCSWPPSFSSQQLYFSSSSFEKYQN